MHCFVVFALFQFALGGIGMKAWGIGEGPRYFYCNESSCCGATSAYSFMFSQDEGVWYARDLIVARYIFTLRVKTREKSVINQYLILQIAQCLSNLLRTAS